MRSDRAGIQGGRGVTWEAGPGTARRPNGIEALRQAIMQDAREEVERILADARARAKDIRARAEARANAERETMMQRAHREAETARGRVIAQAQMEAQTLKLRRREGMLERPFTEARRQLASVPQRPEYEQIACRLVREAARHLDADSALVRADVETREVLSSEVVAELSGELGVYLGPGEPLERGTGVVLETPDGHRRYDNTLENRLARTRDALRTPVYHILIGEEP